MKKLKMPSSYTILFLIIVIVALLTWIVPAGEYVEVKSYDCADGYTAMEVAEVDVCVNESDYARATHDDYLEFEAQVYAIANDEPTTRQATRIQYEIVKEDKITVTNEYSELEDNNGQGLWQILTSPVYGFHEAVGIALFVLVIGGFIGVVMETGALDAGIASILRTFKGREHFLIPILMIIFSLGGTSFGLAEETIAFYPLIIPIIIGAGYDVATAVMIVLLGAGCGVLGSTVNPFAIGAASEAAGISMGAGMPLRFVLLIAVEAFAIFYTMRYAASVKKDINNSKVADLHEEHVKHFLHGKGSGAEVKIKDGHAMVNAMFIITFIIMVISVMPWEDFGVNVFSVFNTWLNEVPFIGGFFTGVSGATALGAWWFEEMTMLFLTSSVIIALYAKAKGLLADKNAISVWINGSKDLLSVALIIGLSRGIKIVMDAGSMSATLLYYGSSALEGLSNITFTILNYIFYIPMSFLIPSTSGLAGASMPIMGPLGEIVMGSQKGTELVITGYSAASGIVNLVTPTSGVVMGGLMIAKLPYGRWLKIVTPVLIGVFIITIIVLSVGAVI